MELKSKLKLKRYPNRTLNVGYKSMVTIYTWKIKTKQPKLFDSG